MIPLFPNVIIITIIAIVSGFIGGMIYKDPSPQVEGEELDEWKLMLLKQLLL